MITLADLLPWRRPPSARPQPPAKPEWERIAEEIIAAPRPVGLDLIVFGDWPAGTPGAVEVGRG